MNQIELFESENNDNDQIISSCEDWVFDERLTKEFESVGFFISDHPLNQYKDIFLDYKIIDFDTFNKIDENRDYNIAATILKIQERKTQKGNSYAILKLSDLSSVFELFIFSDVLELNREKLKDGNSLLLTINKNKNVSENRFRRINVKKIASLKDIFNKPISNIDININHPSKIKEISNHFIKDGDTEVKISIKNKDKNYVFKLKNKRSVDRKSLNLLKKHDISSVIY